MTDTTTVYAPTPSLTVPDISPEEEALLQDLAKHYKKEISALKPPNIVDWASRKYYIPETSRPIELSPHQRTTLNLAMHSPYNFTTMLYSTIKKSGKTAVAGLVGRYVGEFSGPKAEVYFVANDKEQAKDRAYESAKTSIELDPKFSKNKRTLPGSWRIIERQCLHEPTSSIMRAIASDYEGAAGGNPTLTCWTELWGFTLERFKRLWDELTPVPTRKRSMRWVETYAGFEDESELLLDLYKQGMRGRRVTYKELEEWASPAGTDPWPYADRESIPLWINEDTRMLTYWDTAVEPTNYARRMWWQLGSHGNAYYKEQLGSLRPEAFERLHRNLWQSSISEFIQIAHWRACKRDEPVRYAEPKREPIVVAVDASVSGDLTAIDGVSRHPSSVPVIGQDAKGKPTELPSLHETDCVLRFSYVFEPDATGTIDHNAVEQRLRDLAQEFNIVLVTYDAYQVHGMMQRLSREGVAWCKPFSQASDREIADKALYDAIIARRIWHNDEFDERFVQNAAAYQIASGGKIDRLRIVKKHKDAPVDPLVAFSMARSECMRLLL